jgi:hypothetical protein
VRNASGIDFAALGVPGARRGIDPADMAGTLKAVGAGEVWLREGWRDPLTGMRLEPADPARPVTRRLSDDEYAEYRRLVGPMPGQAGPMPGPAGDAPFDFAALESSNVRGRGGKNLLGDSSGPPPRCPSPAEAP